LLFVLGNEENMKRKGIEVVNVVDLKIKDLSPNGEPGRLVCYTKSAIEDIKNRFQNASLKNGSALRTLSLKNASLKNVRGSAK